MATLVLAPFAAANGEDARTLRTFERVQLTDVYYSEGVAVGDINQNGHADVVHGPFWFAGPDWSEKYEIYPARAQPREAYADNFFSWVYDFDGDGWPDVLTVGLPGSPAVLYRNPGPEGWDQPWPKYQVFDAVSNESPTLTDLTGDGRPELVCTYQGRFGYVTPNWEQPLEAWQFHPISEAIAHPRFGHGLGVGDINGNGRLDVLTKDGWLEQPESLEGSPLWKLHRFPFSEAGGAQMFAYDVNGNGRNDVITSLDAHGYGLAWFEQLKDGEQITFRRHVIMDETPEDNAYGVVFTEPHSLALVDIDGDGLKDIVTGKTYWSHHTSSPMWDAGAVVYWFQLQRGEDGTVEWIPHRADGEAGVGRQLAVADVTGNGLPDIVTGGMKGCHVLKHTKGQVDYATWRNAQPQRHNPLLSDLTPEQAARHMTAAPEFDVLLAAGEPDVRQPIAMAIDDRGRVWVAEAYEYPLRAPEGEGRDRIIILEDTNGDGRLDSRKVFFEGLNLVSGLEVGFGGVWVGAAPYLLFIPDHNGDDRPDGEPQVLLDGFGYQDTHETLNSFTWGPDGWLYGCHGVFTHSRVGKPGTPDDERIGLNAGIWRYHPTRHEFEIFAWGTSNPWGIDFNDHGQAFITACVIPHLFHVIQGARYHRQAGQHFNPYVYDDIKTIADHVHYEGDIRDHAWWGHEPELPTSTDHAGGGHAHCGAMIYLGDHWPQHYRNQIFMNNIHGNRVNVDRLEPHGSGFIGRHEPDFVKANDRWFRGIDLKYGPDGNVYLIDWYDQNACHRTDPDIWDRSNGRIFKIVYNGPSSSDQTGALGGMDELPNLAQQTDLELVSLVTSRNEWLSRTARRLLQERGGSESVHQALREILFSDQPIEARLRTLWTLHTTGGLDEPQLLDLLDDAEPYVRGWSVQLALEDRQAWQTHQDGGAGSAPMDSLLEKMAERARSDESPVVRLYLASALQRLPLEYRWEIAEGLLTHGQDAEDHNLPLVIWYGIESLVPADPERAMELAANSQIPQISQFITRRAAGDDETLEHVVAELADADAVARQQMILQEMLQAFEGRADIPMPAAWTPAYDQLAASESSAVRDLADRVAVVLGDHRIFPHMRQVLVDAESPIEQRRQAMDILIEGRDEQAVPALQAVLDEPQLRGPAIRALGRFDHPDTAPALLERYASFDDQHKQDAIGVLVSRRGYADALLDAMAEQQVPRTDLHAYHVRQMAEFDDPQFAQRLRDVWGEVRETSADKLEQIAQYEQLLTPDKMQHADPSNGRRLFNRTCANCHVLFGQGETVGPDITGSNRTDIDYLLQNIVDPNAVVGQDYRMTVVLTEDGRVLSGMLERETDSAITLRTINESIVVPKRDIEARQLSDLSLMPENLLDSLSDDEIRDLIAYLTGPTQVPLRGPQSPIDPDTGRVAGAIEGAQMTIVGKTSGTARSQGMGSFAKDRWSNSDQLWWTGAAPGDRLELEVPVEQSGEYLLEIVMTRARDYGIVQLSLNGQPLDGPIDLYNDPDVVTTGVLTFGPLELEEGEHTLGVEIMGANPNALPAYMFGLDYLRLVPPSSADGR